MNGTIVGLITQMAQWVIPMMFKVFVRWWRDWLRRNISKSIVATDFKMDVAMGTDPPMLRLTFDVHNGSSAHIQFIRASIHVYCGGVYIGSVAGKLTETPLIKVSQPKPKHGQTANWSVNMVPDLYAWTYLPDGGYDLVQSAIWISTVWGEIQISLNPSKINNEVKTQKDRINQFRKGAMQRLVQ